MNASEKHSALAGALDKLLAGYTLYYQKTKNFHWNVEGTSFFELHEQFEEMYVDARDKIDAIAERILMLGFKPTSNLSAYLTLSPIEESGSDLSDRQMIEALASDTQVLEAQMREAMKQAAQVEDEGTIDLLGGYLHELEKMSWMFRAWLGKKSQGR